MNMIDHLALACAVGCGLMAGFFFAFSICVMKALGRLPPEQGIAAMQAINVVVINQWFLITFFGTAALCVLATIGSFVRSSDANAWLMLAGTTLYIVGTVGVTIRFNVPRNNALAAAIPNSVEGERVWVDYIASWTAWNHVRTIAAVAATALFVLAQRS
jgi:uncharacterized membrane protein